MCGLSESLARFYGEENGIAAQAAARRRLSSAFSKFLSAYHAASFAIDTLPHQRMLADLRQRAFEEQSAAVESIRSDLEIERDFLVQELIARGGSDEEGIQIKSEIEVELLHLRHLAAVAGAALARMTAQPPPIDPIDCMQLEIAEREAGLAIND
jgi:hypothetical protein